MTYSQSDFYPHGKHKERNQPSKDCCSERLPRPVLSREAKSHLLSPTKRF